LIVVDGRRPDALPEISLRDLGVGLGHTDVELQAKILNQGRSTDWLAGRRIDDQQAYFLLLEPEAGEQPYSLPIF
jgi:hypothetical protein